MQPRDMANHGNSLLVQDRGRFDDSVEVQETASLLPRSARGVPSQTSSFCPSGADRRDAKR
jgi:hypothetical protein